MYNGLNLLRKIKLTQMKVIAILILTLLTIPVKGYSQCGITHTVDTSAMFGFEISFDFSALGNPSKGSAEFFVYDKNDNLLDLGIVDNQWPTFTSLMPFSNGNYYYNGVVTDTAASCQDSIFGTFTIFNQPGGFDSDPSFSLHLRLAYHDVGVFSTAA